MTLKRRYLSADHSVRCFEFLSSTHQNVLEGVAKVVVEEGVDARVDPGGQVSEPGEDLEDGARNVTSFPTKAVDEVRAEEGKPEDDEGGKDPDEGLLRPSLSPVHFRRTTRRQHVYVDHRLRPRPPSDGVRLQVEDARRNHGRRTLYVRYDVIVRLKRLY